MHYVRHTNGDAHFQENVQLAGEWAEDGSIKLTVKKRGNDGKMSDSREIYPVNRLRLLVMGDGKPVIKYRQFQEEFAVVSLSNVLEVAWRPDIRRYMNNE